jgi:hypothetical protein
LEWTELAVAFVQAARRPNTQSDLDSGDYPGDIEGLKRFVHDHGVLPGTDLNILDSVLAKRG